MDFHAPEALDRQALNDALRHIAADDHPQHHCRVDRRERTPVSREPMQPRPPPEGRVDEVDPVVEYVAPFGRGARAPRELAVHGVEHHEAEARQHPPPIISAPEQIECEGAQNCADEGHGIR